MQNEFKRNPVAKGVLKTMLFAFGVLKKKVKPPFPRWFNEYHLMISGAICKMSFTITTL